MATRDPDGLVAEAQRRFAAGALDDAAALCRAALAHAPNHVGAQRQLALILVLGGAFAEALAGIEPIIDRHADDADLQLAYAEALWGARSAAAALPAFRAAAAIAPARPRLRLRLGQALLAAGDAAAARGVLAAVVGELPDDGVALTALGSAEAATDALEPAVARFEAALARAPGDADAAFQLGQALRALGRIDAAIAALDDAAHHNPTNRLLLLALGDALHAGGRLDAATLVLRELVRIAPDWALAWTALGRTVQKHGAVAEAITYYRTARSLDRNAAELDAIIGNALLDSGAVAEAEAHFARSMEGASWNRPERAQLDGAARTRLRVGVLLAPGANNTPTGFILDPTTYDIELVFMLDGVAYPHDRMDACYDVVFNAVGDRDRAHAALARAETLAAALRRPIVNAPRAVADTGRERMAERLAGIPHAIVPATRRVGAAALRDAAMLDDLGWPVLARPVGSHGGTDLEKLGTPAALRAYAARAGDAALYLTAFHDFRSADGRYRKYRLIVVDGEILPYHLAIGADWLVHYFRTDMGADAALREEEARFLADWRAALGTAAAGALAEIVRRVDLDFFGVDCALRGGDLLVFECNAAMLVHDTGTDAPLFAYKRAPAERIRRAVGGLLARRGGRIAPSEVP